MRSLHGTVSDAHTGLDQDGRGPPDGAVPAGSWRSELHYFKNRSSLRRAESLTQGVNQALKTKDFIAKGSE